MKKGESLFVNFVAQATDKVFLFLVSAIILISFCFDKYDNFNLLAETIKMFFIPGYAIYSEYGNVKSDCLRDGIDFRQVSMSELSNCISVEIAKIGLYFTYSMVYYGLNYL